MPPRNSLRAAKWRQKGQPPSNTSSGAASGLSGEWTGTKAFAWPRNLHSGAAGPAAAGLAPFPEPSAEGIQASPRGNRPPPRPGSWAEGWPRRSPAGWTGNGPKSGAGPSSRSSPSPCCSAASQQLPPLPRPPDPAPPARASRPPPLRCAIAAAAISCWPEARTARWMRWRSPTSAPAPHPARHQPAAAPHQQRRRPELHRWPLVVEPRESRPATLPAAPGRHRGVPLQPRTLIAAGRLRAGSWP
jgi:hypothetical protein